MALKIRLSRVGRKSEPHYRIVVIPAQKSRDGQAIDIIGHYHPTMHNESRIVINKDLFEHYLSNGAQPTERVVKLANSLGFESVAKFLPKYTVNANHGKSKKEIAQSNKAKK